MNPKEKKVDWWEVEDRIHKLGIDITGSNIYGVPRGGMCALSALKYARPVYLPSHANVILDDIIDSGTTLKAYKKQYPDIPFVALYNKLENPNLRDTWFKFPWEESVSEEPAEDGILRLLQSIGEDVTRDGLIDTPKRVVKALREMTSGTREDPKEYLRKTFIQGYDEMVVSLGIRFSSLCEHHLLPFFGVVHVGYLPANGRVVGISKLTRVVRAFSQRLQIQERLVSDIANTINECLTPNGVGVIVRAHHTCMGCRGVKQPDSDMITSCMLGAFRNDPAVRNEFLTLVHGR